MPIFPFCKQARLREDKDEAFFFFFARESGEWAERAAGRSEHGDSDIKASEQLFGEMVSALQMKEDVEQTQGEQSRGNPGRIRR